MDKVVDLKRVLEKTKAEMQTEDSQVKNVAQPSNVKKSTNPITANINPMQRAIAPAIFRIFLAFSC